MSDIIVQDFSDEQFYILFQQWIEMEQQGAEFPVPFHEYWWAAGHSRKEDAFNLAKSVLEEGFDFSGGTRKNPGRGRPSELLSMTTAAFESFCLSAHTKQGAKVRKLYINLRRELMRRQKLEQENIKLLPPSLETMTKAAQVLEQIHNSDLPVAAKQIIIDSMTARMANKQLPATTEVVWMGCMQRAEKLGFSTDLSSRTKLGFFVSQFSELNRKRERRICNGQYREIWVYEVCDALDIAIQEFFAGEMGL